MVKLRQLEGPEENIYIYIYIYIYITREPLMSGLGRKHGFFAHQ
jgi:hypothetical protein